MKLNNDLREFIELLNSTKVEYLLVGGHAVAFHGYPRFTGDVDFWIKPTVRNAGQLENLLKEFGFAAIGIKAADFMVPGVVIQLGRPPNRIDLLTTIDGAVFDEAWPNRVQADIEGLPVAFIGKSDLIKNKRATGRVQDLADAQKLERIK